MCDGATEWEASSIATDRVRSEQRAQKAKKQQQIAHTLKRAQSDFALHTADGE